MNLKRLSLFLIAFLVVVILISATFFVVRGSQATSGPTSSQHPQGLMPTRSQQEQPHGASPSATPTPPYGSGDLTWHGGNFATNPQAYLIFWGPGWSMTSPEVQLLKSYFTDVSGSSFESILTQYYQSGNHIPDTETLAGIWLDSATPATDSTCGTHTIEAAALAAEVQHAVTTQGWPTPSWDATYFVYTPNGYSVNAGAGYCSEQTFCAYHGYFSGTYSVQNIYAAIPYPSNLANCGVPTAPSGNSYADSLVNLTSYQQFETITDPDFQGGWSDSVGYEIADKCAWDFTAGPTTLANGGTYEIQEEYSNLTSTCMNSYTPAPRFQTDVPQVALTATPGISPEAYSLQLTNRGTATLNWSAAALPSWVSVSPTSGTLTAGNSQPLTLRFTLPPTSPSSTYTTNLVLTDPNAVYSTFTVPITLVLTNVSRQWYFAEGFTGPGFTEYLTLANPNPTQTMVMVKYLLQGAAPILKTYTLSANSRFTLNINGEIGAGKNVSMVVTGTQPIIAERPMYFTFGGKIPGGSDVLGATSLSTDFDFGYLDTTTNHDTYLTILNQDPTTAMDVAISYFAAAGGNPIVIHHSIPANSRGTVHINTEQTPQGTLPKGTYSALVHLSLPGLVERPMYLKDAATGNTGAGDVVGVAQPLTDWYFAEGFVSSAFSERYILSNPSTTDSASGTVTFFLDSGAPKTASFTLAPGAQTILNVNGILSGNNSAQVHADHAILAERFMSFKFGSANIPGATDVLGSASPSNLFEFAEGFTGTGFSEYLTIENPSTTDIATLQVRFLPAGGGTPVVRFYLLAPSSRGTLNTATVMPNQSFSMVVESNVPIVAERPMYFTFPGARTGGSDVVGYQPPGALPSTGLTVYAGASNGYLYAIDARTGNTRWGYNIGGQLAGPTEANGIVYVGATDGFLYAIHTSDGSLAWRYQTGAAIHTKPLVAGGIVYISSQDGYTYALDASTGSFLWRYQASGIYSSPVVANGVLYIGSYTSNFGSYTGSVYALNASSGDFLWSFQTGSYIESTPAVSNGVVYIGSDDRHFYALSADTGTVLWSYYDSSPNSTGIYRSPVVSAGVVYVPAGDGSVEAFNASTGDMIWHQQAGNMNAGPITLALDDENVYVGSSDGHFYVLDISTGAPRWNVSTEGSVTSVLVADGAVFFSSMDGSLQVLDTSNHFLRWGYYFGLYIQTSLTVGP